MREEPGFLPRLWGKPFVWGRNLFSWEVTFPTAGKTMPPVAHCPHVTQGCPTLGVGSGQWSGGRERPVQEPVREPGSFLRWSSSRGETIQAHLWGGEGCWLAQPARTGSPRVTRETRGDEVCEESLLPTPTQRIPAPHPRSAKRQSPKLETRVAGVTSSGLSRRPTAPHKGRGLCSQAGWSPDPQPQSLRSNEGIDRHTRP